MGARHIQPPEKAEHDFAFAGFLTCAHDGTVTSELQQGKYITIAARRGKGKCSPYMREQDVSERFGELLKDIYVSDALRSSIVNTPQAESGQEESVRRARISGLQQRLSALRSRMD